MLIYIAGKYSADTDEGITANIEAARKVAIELWEAGHIALCPHLNTAHFERDCNATYRQYIDGDLDMLSRCDAILMLPGWENSQGAKAEWGYAKELGMPIHLYPEIPPRHAAELRCPEQTKAFREVLGQMLRTHHSKNSDYSAANILATGELGLVTRLWDKVARLMNLSGFRFELVAAGEYTAPRTPKHESIDDTLMDTAVYAVIGKLLRMGKWGR